MDNHGIFVLSRAENARFFECTSHRLGAFVCILYHVCQCFGWSGVGLITFLGACSSWSDIHVSTLVIAWGQFRGVGGEAMITFLIVRSWCFILMKWHTSCYAVHSSWYNFDLATWPMRDLPEGQKNMCHCVRVAANQILLLVNRPS